MRQMTCRNEVSLPLDRYPLARSSSVDEVRQLYSKTASPIRVEVPGRERFQCRLNCVAVGPVTISTIWSRSRVVGVAEMPVSSYFLSFGRAGYSEHINGKRSTAVVANHSGTCTSPSMAPTARLQAGFQGVQVKIERTAMEAALAALLCVPSRASPLFDQSFSVTSGFGADAVRFLDFLIAELDQGSAWPRTPIVANRWLEGFLFHMLLGLPNSHSEQLHARPVSAEPRYLRQVADHLASHALEPVTLTDLSTLTGMSVRSHPGGLPSLARLHADGVPARAALRACTSAPPGPRGQPGIERRVGGDGMRLRTPRALQHRLPRAFRGKPEGNAAPCHRRRAPDGPRARRSRSHA